MKRRKSLTSRVKNLALSHDMDYVGIAPVERFVNAPRGHTPGDILPGATSVISMSMKINSGVQLSQRMALHDRRLRHVGFAYRWFGYGLLNMFFMDEAAFLVARLLEKEGHLAVPVVASGVEDSKNLVGLFSNRHAAVAAGLGDIGWNGLCLTPGNGPRQRFVSVITTARLEPDPMYSGPRLCDVERCKELGQGLPLCARVCPAHLFSDDKTLRVAIGGKEFEYAWMERQKCAYVGSGLYKGALGPETWDMPEKVDFYIKAEIRNKLPARSSLEPMIYGRGSFCALCLLRCPVGMSKEVDDIMKAKEENIDKKRAY